MLGEAFQERDRIGGVLWPERRRIQGGKLVGGAVEASGPSSEVRPKKSRKEWGMGGAGSGIPAPNIWEDSRAAA